MNNNSNLSQCAENVLTHIRDTADQTETVTQLIVCDSPPEMRRSIFDKIKSMLTAGLLDKDLPGIPEKNIYIIDDSTPGINLHEDHQENRIIMTRSNWRLPTDPDIGICAIHQIGAPSEKSNLKQRAGRYNRGSKLPIVRPITIHSNGIDDQNLINAKRAAISE